MKIEIKSRWSGSVLFSLETDSLRLAVEAAIKQGADLSDADLGCANLRGADLGCANLRRADLRSADLSRANLSRADLSDANLHYANLHCADLRDANLHYANLRSANLHYADLRHADLRSANLSRADLSDANLHYANLRGADLGCANNIGKAIGLRLPTGETWMEYITKTVPALLTAGGKKLEDVANEDHWYCHSWENCPMAAAFSVHSVADIPILLRPRADQFIGFFDAQMIPLAAVLGK
jgi:hypothetical protein